MKTRSTLGRMAWVVLPALVLLGPRTYACELHPLARLSSQVEEGMSLRAVLSRFETYTDRSDPAAGGSAILLDLVPRGAGEGGVASRILSVQDLWLEEDLELTAWFDESGTLLGTGFRCGVES